MQPIIRPAQPQDIDTLVDFCRRLNREDPTFTGESHFDQAAIRAALTQLLADPSLGRVWLIVASERPAGYVVLTYGFSLESHGRDALIDEIYLMPDYRRQGLGRRVLQQMESEARHLGAARIYLEVERPNTRAQDFYRQLGFEDHDRYLMSKWISPDLIND
jgi:ribosomal protein S18 acetylase RimI-like enzyme